MKITLNQFLRLVADKAITLPRADLIDVAAFAASLPYETMRSHPFDELIPLSAADAVLQRLMSHEPPAYITGRREFYGREFFVTPDVLIPRVETELIIDTVLKKVNRNSTLTVLDLCTGSGCILLTLLAELPNAEGLGVDISPAALSVARENASRLGLSGRAHFQCADALVWQPHTQYDILTCNPPYLTEGEYSGVEPSVMHEPRTALVADEEGLAFYKKLLSYLPKFCTKKGFALFEIGCSQGEQVAQTAHSFGLHAEVLKDLAGLPRTVVVNIGN